MNNRITFAIVAGLVVVAAVAFFILGGKKETIRSYREVEIAPPAEITGPEATSPEEAGTEVSSPGMASPGMTSLPAEASATHPSIAWKAPPGWVEQPGNNMRMATFLVGSEKVECTIVAFPGDVGGPEANIKRWAGQLNIEIRESIVNEIMKRALQVQSAGGYQGLIFDFDELAASRNTPSILAAMFAVGGQTVFIKMMGDRLVLLDEKGNFLALCNSLQ